LIARHGMDEAITRVHPQARVMAYADDCVILHEDRRVLEQRQQLLRTWLAAIGLTLHETKSPIRPTRAGEDPGWALLGWHIRQDRVGQHQAGKRPGGQRLG
jgi:Reverse transcriptase (RNA-dependent DNA polymerase)